MFLSVLNQILLSEFFYYMTGVFPQLSMVNSWSRGRKYEVTWCATCSDIDSGRHLASVVTKSVCP